MATAIQRRRGNTAQHASFTGLAGEITIDTQKNTVVVHDGTTAGGFPLAKADEVEALGGADITAVVAGNGLSGGATSGNANINVGAGAGITVNADNVAVNATYITSLFSATDSGGDGSFSYSDGVFTYTGPSQAEANTRIDARLSSGTGITYTSGVIATTITQYTDTLARGAISVTDAGGDGSLSYDNGTGVITYTGPSQAEANTRIDARISGGSGLTYTSGVLAVGAGTGITVNADDVAVNSSYITGLFSATDSGGDGSFSYSSGVFTYTGPSQSEANTRIDARLSGGTGITYTSGVIATTITQYTDSLARGAISVTDAGGDGSLSYDNGTGVITYTGPSQSEANTRIDARLSGGTGVTYTSGVIAIGQAVGTGNNVTFNDLTVNGNLTVSGTTTTVNTETINLADNIILLNSNEAGTPSQNAGIEIERGTSTNKTLVWDETADKWTVGAETFVAATFEGAVTGNVTGTVSSIANHSTTNLTEGTNLYFTAARARGNISVTDSGGDGSLSYDNSTGVITYTGPSQSEANTRIDARLSGGTGITYTSGVIATTITQYTDTLARAAVSVTDAGGDGSLAYNSSTGVITYTGPSQAEANTRIDARLSGGTGITYTSGVIATTITQYTDSLARGAISVTDAGGDGSLAYNSGTGVITYTGPSATEVRAHFTAGTGVTISSGQVSIGQAVGTNSNVSFNNVTATGNFFGNLTGNVTGNAGTATTLATARTIGGVSFNGSASIDLPGVNTAGNQNTTGNAGTATKWATPRTITLTGDVTGVSGNFDGSGNLSFATTIAANSVALGTDTTGNYVASVANGAYITGGSAGSEGATLTLAVDATTTATASKVAARDASGDLYATIFQGTASSARYADLAERYEADAILEPGTVVCFGGEKEITACDHENDHAVAGVVSTDPAYMMNSAAGNNDTHPYIALTGRVPVKVVGPVAKGDLLVASSVKGHATVNNNAKAGTIIGKAISTSDSGEGVVEALINLM